jgi:hypothetical protein
MIDEITEIRMKAIELSVTMCAHITAATIEHHGLDQLREVIPFALVEDIEMYIRTGEIPIPIKPIKVH